METTTAAGTGFVFVLRYPSSGRPPVIPVETIVVAPDSTRPDGWAVRLLRRTFESDG